MATSPINSFWNPNQQMNNNNTTFTNKHFYDPNNRIQVALPPGNQENTGMAIQLANVNPHLFLQGFRLRVCPTKPVPWDEIRRMDFNSLRLSPPDLEKMRDLTLDLIDAQFDANTVFGEVTVQTSNNAGYVVKPVPSVGDVVALCRSLQAVLQFNLHSIQALKDQVRKQTIINQNFECELKRLTNDHVTQHAASTRAKESQIIYLEERIAKLVADNTKLREALISAESKNKELAIEGSSSQLAWREERMRLQEENHALRQFIAGHGGGLDSDSRKTLFENILNGGKFSNNDENNNKKESRKSSSHHRHHHHHHDKNKSSRPSSSSHHHHHNADKKKSCCDSVSCHKCGRGSLRPIPFAIVNQQLPPGNPSPLAPPPPPPAAPPSSSLSEPAKVPKEPTKEQQQQQSTLLPFQAPSTMEQLRMQDSIDQNRKRSDENFHKIENLLRNQNDELRTSIKNVGEVAQKSMQIAHDAENRQRSSNDQVAEAVLKLRQSQQESETKVLGVLQQNDNQLRQQIDKMGTKLQKETKAVADSVDNLARRVGNLEEDVDKLKNAPPPPKHISIALKDSRSAEYPQLPPPQQVSPSKLPRQQQHPLEDHQNANNNINNNSTSSTSKSTDNNLYPYANKNPEGVQAPRQPGQTFHEKQKQKSPSPQRRISYPQQQQQDDDDVHDHQIDPKLVVLPLSKNNNNTNNNNPSSQNVQISLISATYKPDGNDENNINNNNHFIPPPPPPPLSTSQQQNNRAASAASNRSSSASSPKKIPEQQKTPPRDESLLPPRRGSSQNLAGHQMYQPHENKKRRGPDDSETLSTTDPDDSFQLRRRQKRSARKGLEQQQQQQQQQIGNNVNDDEEDVDALSDVEDVSNNKNGRKGDSQLLQQQQQQQPVNDEKKSSFRRDPDEDHLVDDGMLMTTPVYGKSANVAEKVYMSPKRNDNDDSEEDEFGEKKTKKISAVVVAPTPNNNNNNNKPESALDKIKRELAELEALG